MLWELCFWLVFNLDVQKKKKITVYGIWYSTDTYNMLIKINVIWNERFFFFVCVWPSCFKNSVSYPLYYKTEYTISIDLFLCWFRQLPFISLNASLLLQQLIDLFFDGACCLCLKSITELTLCDNIHQNTSDWKCNHW